MQPIAGQRISPNDIRRIDRAPPLNRPAQRLPRELDRMLAAPAADLLIAGHACILAKVERVQGGPVEEVLDSVVRDYQQLENSNGK